MLYSDKILKSVNQSATQATNQPVIGDVTVTRLSDRFIFTMDASGAIEAVVKRRNLTLTFLDFRVIFWAGQEKWLILL